jgi:hypothetical protein
MAKHFREPTPEEQAFREKCREEGLLFRGNPKMETMKAKYEEFKRQPEEGKPSPELAVPSDTDIAMQQAKSGERLYMTAEEFRQSQAKDAKRNAGRLVRCRITCMNPMKREWTGEIISVGSARLGTFKKFIPYNLDTPYHIPKIIYEYLKERKCRIGTTQKLPNGQEVNRHKLVNEFAIEVLPPLTPAELHELKQRQAMAEGGM